MKLAVAQLILIYPVRRLTLEQLHNVIDTLTGTEGDKAMHVLDPAVQRSDKDVLCPCILSDVLKYFVSDRVCEKWFAVPFRPYEMYPNTYVGHMFYFWADPGDLWLLSSTSSS